MFKKINGLNDFGILVIRLMLGAVFVFHGSQKLFGVFDGAGLASFAKYIASIGLPYPAYGAVLAGGAEFLGGLALIGGYGMRTMALPLIVTMGVASWYGHAHTFSIQSQGMEYPLSLGVILIGLACTGPGKFALRRLWPERLATWSLESKSSDSRDSRSAADDEIRRRVLRRKEPATRSPEPPGNRQPAAHRPPPSFSEELGVSRVA